MTTSSLNIEAVLDEEDEIGDSYSRRKKRSGNSEIDHTKYAGTDGLKEGYTITVSGIAGGKFYEDCLPYLAKSNKGFPEGVDYTDDLDTLVDSMINKWDLEKTGVYIDKKTVH